MLRTALRESPLDRGLRFDAAAACEAARDADSAETILREGLGRPSEDIQMAKALLDFYTRAGRRNSKLNLLREWVSDEPDHPELRMLLEQAQAEYVR